MTDTTTRTLDQLTYTALSYRYPQFMEAVRDMADIVPPQLLDEWFAQLRLDLDRIQAEFETRQAAEITAPSIIWVDEFEDCTGTPGPYHIEIHRDDDGDIESCSVLVSDEYLGGAKTVEGAKAFAERHARIAQVTE